MTNFSDGISSVGFCLDSSNSFCCNVLHEIII